MSFAAGRTAFHPDLEKLLQPIRPDAPSGDYLLYEGTYDKIREARREDDQQSDRGVWTHALKKADWTAVEKLCWDALEQRTHDLQIAGWLLEAWLHKHGLLGFREGMRLMVRLCERYWESLQPPLDPDDPEYRFSPLFWLDERLATQLMQHPLTKPESEDVPPFCLVDWDHSCRQTSASAAEPGGMTQARVRQSVLLTPTTFLLELHRSADASVRTVENLRDVLAGLAPDAPSLHQLRGVLERIRERATGWLAERNEHPDGPPPPKPAEVSMASSEDARNDSAQDAGSDGPRIGGIRSRTEAYTRLAEIAEYLSRTEPHSPTPYLIRRAVAWGSMRLEDLLPELVRSQSDLGEIFRLLSIAANTHDED